jgi:uncharacterized membrane protein YtjA (UPF0391 family)
MRRNSGNGTIVTTATGSPTAEHRKAGRAGQIALDGALAFLVISGIAAVAGHFAIASTAAGVCVALFVVGLMLHYEGERQRQRPDPSRSDRGK